MPFVKLGNPAAMHAPDGVLTPLAPAGEEVITTSWQPPSYTLDEMVHNLAHPAEGQWNSHSAARRPAWVWSDDAELAAALGDAFGCPVRDTDPEIGVSNAR
jgi:hypothetical protein